MRNRLSGEYELCKKFYNWLRVNKPDIESESTFYRYLLQLKTMSENNPEIDFTDLQEGDIIQILPQIEDSEYKNSGEYSESTKDKYRGTLKYLCEWNDVDIEEAFPKDYKFYRRSFYDDITDFDDIPNPHHIKILLQKIEKSSKLHSRQRNVAFFFALWDTGARVGELIRVEKKDVEIHEDGVTLPVKGNKESSDRESFCYFAGPALKRYISNHPDPESKWLWVNTKSDQEGRAGYSRLKDASWRAYNMTDFDLGWSNQPIHIWRKSNNTWFSEMEIASEKDIDVRSGRVIGSKITRLYTRKDDRQANESIKENLGLETAADTDHRK